MDIRLLVLECQANDGLRGGRDAEVLDLRLSGFEGDDCFGVPEVVRTLGLITFS